MWFNFFSLVLVWRQLSVAMEWRELRSFDLQRQSVPPRSSRGSKVLTTTVLFRSHSTARVGQWQSDSLWLFAFFALLWYGRRPLVQILWWPLCSTIYSLLCSFFQQHLAATLLYYYCSLIIQLSGLVLGLTSVLVLCPPCPLLMSLSVTSHVSECDHSIDVVILMLSLSVFFSVFSFLCYSFNMTKSIFC